MRNKFLGTGESGFDPVRKTKIIISGLRYAVMYDLSVTYKLVLSLIVLLIFFFFRQWVDFLFRTPDQFPGILIKGYNGMKRRLGRHVCLG